MGILKGDVDVLGLGNLFQTLATHGREGVLKIQSGQDRKSIYFGPHGVRVFSTTMKRINRLGRIMLRRGKLNADELRSFLEEQKLLGFKLGDILINASKITRRDLEEALLEQLEEEIFDTFMWSGASFEFVEGPPQQKSESPLAEYTFDINIAGIVLEAARREDELLRIRKLLHDDEVLLREAKDFDQFRGERALGAAILQLADGRRTVREIVHVSTYPRFATLNSLYALVRGGYLRPKTPTVRRVLPGRRAAT